MTHITFVPISLVRARYKLKSDLRRRGGGILPCDQSETGEEPKCPSQSRRAQQTPLRLRVLTPFLATFSVPTTSSSKAPLTRLSFFHQGTGLSRPNSSPGHTHISIPRFCITEAKSWVQQGWPQQKRLAGVTQLTKPGLSRRMAEGHAWGGSQVTQLCPVAQAHRILPTSQSMVLADLHMADIETLK